MFRVFAWDHFNLRFLQSRTLYTGFGPTSCAKLGRNDIIVIAGGVIPEQDHDFLYKSGVSSIFGPGSVIAESAIEILKKLMK